MDVTRDGDEGVPDSQLVGLDLEEGAEHGTLRAPILGSKVDVAKDADAGALVSLNGATDDDDGSMHVTSRDVGSTIKLGDAVEEDARAVARSLTALLACLKTALSEVTGSSVDHLRSENEAAGQVQDAAIAAATKGNRFVNACLRLNEEMKGMKHVASQLETLKQKVDQFERQAHQYLPRH